MVKDTNNIEINPVIDLQEVNIHLPSKEKEGVAVSDDDQDISGDTIVPEKENGNKNVQPKKTDPKDDEDEESLSRWKRWKKVIRTPQFQVYVSQFLSSWGDRMWMFAGGLFLLQVTPGSMRLAAVYGAALAITVITLGAPIGRWIDRTPRLRAAQASLCVQNIMVCVCAGILVVMTTQKQLFEAWDGWALVLGQTLAILTACLAQIGTVGTRLTIERDWILVICGQDKSRLAGMNSVLRSLDLSTDIFAPMIVGTVMTSFGMAAGGIVIAGWNLGSLIFEYGLLHHIYYSNKDLQKPKGAQNVKKETEEGSSESEKKPRWSATLWYRIKEAWESWVAYMNHPVRDAGLGQSFLYVTVLSFNNYSRAFIFESGVSETILGVLTATASLFGIFGAMAYPKLRRKIGVAKTGLLGYTAEIICMALCVGSVFAPGSPFEPSAITSGGQIIPSESANLEMTYNTTLPRNVSIISIENQNVTEIVTLESQGNVESNLTSVILLLVGMITSRTGLWLSDLSVTQILQEHVQEDQRGSINGVQWSLNQSFDLLRAILLIILPTRETFGFLIVLSFSFVLIGLLLFGIYVRREWRRSPDTDDLQVYHF